MTKKIELIEKFKAEAAKAGAKVLVAENREKAIDHINNIIRSKRVNVVVKASCPLAGSLKLLNHLSEQNISVCETSLVQWAIRLTQNKEVPLEEVAGLVATATGEIVDHDPEAVLQAAKRALKNIYANADLGITEADFGIAETGTLITLENEGNQRLAAVLPRLHLTIIEAKNIVLDLAEAAEMIKRTAGGIPGCRLPTFITYLTGRNTTADIPGALFARAQGPEEEYILLIELE